jgi:uncharacterized protein (DUF697 family)
MELDRKSLASFRVLVAIARADGNLAPEELEALKVALGERSDLLDSLLAENIDVDHELGQLSQEDRERVYQSGFALAYADKNASTGEVTLLKKLLPNAGESSLLGQVFGETLDTIVPGRIVAEPDPVKRSLEITEDIVKYSILAAVAGAMPVPGVAIVADLAVIALQAKMVHDIGLYWGHSLDGPAVRGFMGSVTGSTIMRIAVTNLARFVPGWGSAFGAATSFASTFALGKVAERYFEAGRGLDESEMKGLYESMRAEGAARYDAQKSRIDTAEVLHGRKIGELNDELATGKISRADYDRAIAELGL